MPAPTTVRGALIAFLTVLLVSLTGPVLAQSGGAVRASSRSGTVFVELTDLARAAGVVATGSGDVFTYRGPLGVVTFFAGSSAGLQQRPGDGGPTEVSFSAPVIRTGEEWWAPLDALELLGVAPDPTGVAVDLATGVRVALALEALPGSSPNDAAVQLEGDDAAWEVGELAAGVPVLRFFHDGVGLTLVDLALLPLARPELTAQVDAALDDAWRQDGARDNLLLLQVTAVEESAWDNTLRFAQGSRELEVRYPYRLLLQVGSAETVAPDAPVAGVVLLPAGFDLYRPLRVEWAGVSAEVSFRR
ncbi:MAG: hypothetical protein WC972_05610 [Trueperaceae bacterium]|jgi:hypothetical protein|nr:hypothetical protein [Trueperaceae bacterium]HRQ09982.1 hypothetical protein [Trueperaceae bacterium]